MAAPLGERRDALTSALNRGTRAEPWHDKCSIAVITLALGSGFVGSRNRSPSLPKEVTSCLTLWHRSSEPRSLFMPAAWGVKATFTYERPAATRSGASCNREGEKSGFDGSQMSSRQLP